jgi:hypothetical protein
LFNKKQWKEVFDTQFLDLYEERWLAMGKKGF